MNGSARESGSRHGDGHEHQSGRHRDGDRNRDRDRDRERERGGERRRRSRSPGRGSSRRDYEVDSYSSSRDNRDRERERHYRDRRDDREWDRDRAPRREGRRGDEHERRPRHDRDLFEDRRGGGGGGAPGGGGGGRRERDKPPPAAPAAAGRERRRTPSPPRRPKEPTPDLTDTVSVLERRRRLTQWDIKPQGYENVTSQQAKLSGMFPLPGAPRQQTMDPSRMQAMMNTQANATSSSNLQLSHARQSKRLFADGVPPNVSSDAINDFFNLQMNGLNAISSQDPCIAAQIGADEQVCLLEFKTPEDTTLALAMDGISMAEHDQMNGGSEKPGFRLRRPNDYIAPLAMEEDTEYPGVMGFVKDGPNKIAITNIPWNIPEDQVQQLLETFGVLKAFQLVKYTETQESRGIAFAEYKDPQMTEPAIDTFRGTPLGDGVLAAQRASVGASQAADFEKNYQAMGMLAGTSTTEPEQGRVVQLLNMVTPEELMNNDDYAEICEDVQEECGKFGKILEMKIPRPSGASRQSNGVGKIFIKYDSAESAQRAITALAGRQFSQRTVVVTTFDEEYFNLEAW